MTDARATSPVHGLQQRPAAGVLLALMSLCRLYYALPLGFTLGLTIVYARDGHMRGQWTGAVMASLALALVTAAGYAFNDVCDCRADRINAPGRPLVTRQLPGGIACVWAALLAAAGVAVAVATCRPAFTVLLTVVAAGLILYDLTSKRLGPGKQLLVAALMTSIYPLAIAQADPWSGWGVPEIPSRIATLLFFPGWLFLTSFGYEILKDIRDRLGDVAANGRSNWISRDPRRARRLAGGAVLLGAVILLGPGLVGCGTVYISIIPAAMLAAIVSLFLPLRPALAALYVECVLVGIAATADLLG